MAHVETVVAPEATTGSIWDREHAMLTIGLILTILGPAFEALAVANTMPATVRELGGIGLYGWAFSAFMLANLIGITIAGGEIDRLGPGKPYLVGMGLFAAGLLISGLAPTMEILIVGRTVQGLGGGFNSAIVYVIVARGYHSSAKARMLALVSTAWVVPGLIGPALAGLIVDFVGWRWVFLGILPLIVIAIVLTTPSLRRLGGDASKTRDQARTVTSIQLAFAAGVFLAGLGMSGALAVVVTLGGLAFTIFTLRRLLPPGTLRAAAGMPAAIATHGLLNLAFFGVDTFLPLGFTEVRGQTATITGLALTAATLTWTAGSWLLARIARTTSRRLIAAVGLVLIGVGIALFTATLDPRVPVAVGVIAWAIAGLGIGLSFTTLSLVTLENAPAGGEGVASSALQLANVLGVAIGAGIGGALVAQTNAGPVGAAQGILLQSAIMTGVVIIALLAVRGIPARPPQNAPDAAVGPTVP
jgi:MFS family permease